MDDWRERAKCVENQFAAMEAITELFLTRKIVLTYSDEKELDKLNKQRFQEANAIWCNRPPLALGIEKQLFRYIAEHHLSASKQVVQRLLHIHTH